MAKHPQDFWCPMSRLSIQNFERGNIETLPVAFNTVVRTDPNTGGNEVILSSRCCGESCALWERGKGCGLKNGYSLKEWVSLVVLFFCIAALLYMGDYFV